MPTKILFASGHQIEVQAPYDEVARAMDDAKADRKTFELRDPESQLRVAYNPDHVQQLAEA